MLNRVVRLCGLVLFCRLRLSSWSLILIVLIRSRVVNLLIRLLLWRLVIVVTCWLLIMRLGVSALRLLLMLLFISIRCRLRFRLVRLLVIMRL